MSFLIYRLRHFIHCFKLRHFIHCFKLICWFFFFLFFFHICSTDIQQERKMNSNLFNFIFFKKIQIIHMYRKSKLLAIYGHLNPFNFDYNLVSPTLPLVLKLDHKLSSFQTHPSQGMPHTQKQIIKIMIVILQSKHKDNIIMISSLIL